MHHPRSRWSSPTHRAPIAVLSVLAVMAVALVALAPVVLARSQQATIADSEYKPNDITINVNEVVTWISDSDKEHTVTADDGSFDSGRMARGEAFANVFSRPGTYTYHCIVYGFTGKVTVEGSGPTPRPTAAPTPTPPPGTLPPSFVPAETPAASAPAATADASAPPVSETSQGLAFSPVVLIGAIVAVVVAIVLALFVIPRPGGRDEPGS